MRKKNVGLLVMLMAGLCLLLSGCGEIDESILDTPANLSVDISVPYATATPLPEYLNVPDAIVIDAQGNVTLNDTSIIEGNFQSAKMQEEENQYKNLNLGSTGIAVQALQSRLRALKYFDGDVSGLFDTATEASVKRFEQTYGTMQTGVATAKLQLKLFAANAPTYDSDEYHDAVDAQYTTLRPGMVGSSVYALQQRLKNLEYPIYELTGVFDDQTTRCVRLFYQAYNASPNDVATVTMQKALYSDSAIAYNSGKQSTTLPPDQSDTNDQADAFDTSEFTVTQIQQRLIELGYMASGGDNGTFDDVTQRGVNRFLQNIGQEPDGMLSVALQTLLFSDNAPAFGEDLNTSTYQNLSPGDSGDTVLNLQNRLVELGYASGSPNAKYGNATIEAVKLYQKSNGFDEDGLASAYLQSILFSEKALAYEDAQDTLEEPLSEQDADALYFNLALGSSGKAVSTLQNRLVVLGYLDNVTSTYDEATEQAVTQFQNVLGAPATGQASPSMQRYIYSKAAPNTSYKFYEETQSFAALSQDDTGEAVIKLQRRLWELGYLKRDDVEDSIGTYNEATALAVTNAQLKMEYESSDGKASIEFQCYLYSKYGKYLKV